MKILHSILILVVLTTSSLNAWTFSPKEFLKTGNLDDLFTVKQTEEQQKISDYFFKQINTPEKQWKLEKDPFDFDAEMSFCLIPSDQDSKNITERIELKLYKNHPLDSIEKIWNELSKNYSEDLMKILNKNQNEFDFIFQMGPYSNSKIFYMIGHVELLEKDKHFFFFHTIKNKKLTDECIAQIINNLKKSKWSIK